MPAKAFLLYALLVLQEGLLLASELIDDTLGEAAKIVVFHLDESGVVLLLNRLIQQTWRVRRLLFYGLAAGTELRLLLQLEVTGPNGKVAGLKV